MKKHFRSLEINVRKLLNSYSTGGHVSSLKDSIIDVDVVREYQPGDRRLDSRASLRTSSTMSRVFTPEKSMGVVLVLDVSSSQSSKLEAAVCTCLYMCYLADQMYDTVGLFTFGDRVSDFVQPSDDVRNVSSVLEKIYNRKDLARGSNLDDVLLRVGNLELSNTLVVLVSDFCFPLSEKTVGLLRRVVSGANNSAIAAVLANTQEWSFEKVPFRVDFVDSETADYTNWNFGSASAHKNHLTAFQQWQNHLKGVLYQGRVEPIMMHVDQSEYLMPLVKHFLRA